MNRFRPYLSAFRLRARLETQYRLAAVSGVVTQAFFGLVLVFLYTALYAGGDPRSLRDTVSYVWLQQAFFRALLATDGELRDQVLTGGLAYTLIRPVDQHLWWTSRALAQKIIGVVMRLVPMAALQLVLPPALRLSPPESPLAFAQFLCSLAVGFAVISQIGMIVEAVVLRTLDSRGAAAMLNLVMMVLCGNIIPLTLFPDAVQGLIRWQPFAQALDAPIRMYTAGQAWPDFFLNLGVQAGWAAVLWLAARGLWRRNLRRIIIQGG